MVADAPDAVGPGLHSLGGSSWRLQTYQLRPIVQKGCTAEHCQAPWAGRSASRLSVGCHSVPHRAKGGPSLHCSVRICSMLHLPAPLSAKLVIRSTDSGSALQHQNVLHTVPACTIVCQAVIPVNRSWFRHFPSHHGLLWSKF